MTSLIVGYGEIGHAVQEAFDIDDHLDLNSANINHQRYDVLHISIPWQKDFVKEVNKNIYRFCPQFTIVHSTVPIGTTRKINGFKVHAPVRGRHDRLASGIINDYTNHIGFGNATEASSVYLYYQSKNITNVQFFDKYETTEAAKLLSLFQYGLNVEFARTAKAVCDKHSLSYMDTVTRYTESYNQGIVKYNPELVKTSLTPPEGKIGGHCVLPSVQILADSFTDNLFDAILERNRKFSDMQDLGT